MSFAALWESLLPLGRDAGTGGYRRFSWTPADAECRRWFFDTAAERGLRASADRNGNLWAWWDVPGAGPGGAVVTGSHLDSVPDGGAYDGPLGVVTAFAAIDLLRERGLVPVRPVAAAAFCEEEGARFGVACLGSRLLAGAIEPGRARALTDSGGTTFAEAMTGRRAGPRGPRPGPWAGRGHRCVRGTAHRAGPRARRTWTPRSGWRNGSGRTAGGGSRSPGGPTTPGPPGSATAATRCWRPPRTILAARGAAARHAALATVGKLTVDPGAVNAISSSVTAWLDARAPDEARLHAVVDDVLTQARTAAVAHGVALDHAQESVTPAVDFDAALRDRMVAALAAAGIRAPVLPTGAGHDAGVLAAQVPAGMLFVRNPTGVSHSPAEHADPGDCATGVTALAAVLEDLACR